VRQDVAAHRRDGVRPVRLFLRSIHSARPTFEIDKDALRVLRQLATLSPVISPRWKTDGLLQQAGQQAVRKKEVVANG
jgi:hypothetical protein